jgi:thiol-disulfide isomerase/thioredoxin
MEAGDAQEETRRPLLLGGRHERVVLHNPFTCAPRRVDSRSLVSSLVREGTKRYGERLRKEPRHFGGRPVKPSRLLALGSILLPLVLEGCFDSNTSPVAAFVRSPASGNAPLSVFFDAATSVDPDGAIAGYAWTFGDGAQSAGPTAVHTYSAAGTYEAELAVTDAEGAEDRASRMVDVRAAGATPVVGTAVGDLAPGFSLPSLAGEADVALSELRGYVVLLDFWASTCTPCRVSMPHLESLREQFAGDGLVVLAVNLDVSEDAAREFIEGGDYAEFVVVRDDQESVKSLYGVDGIPHTFLIDRQGTIRHADHPIRIRAWQIEPWL